MKIVHEISKMLNVSNEDILKIIENAPNSYKKFYIKKKNGGNRTIFQPSKSLKSLQYALINLYFCKLPIHSNVYSYKKGLKSPLKENANKHLFYKYNLKIDFKDFFPSIKFYDLKKVLLENDMKFHDKDFEILERIIFPKTHIAFGLPIGAPISPIISNLVMYNLDKIIYNYVNKLSGENCVTRYADDIIFSSNYIKNCREFHKKIKNILNICNSPKIKINEEKTKYLKKGFRKAVTGLIITPDPKISIGRGKKRYIKKLIYDFICKNIDEKGINKLKGYLAFILDIEPRFYDSLTMKYGKVVNTIRKI